MKSKILAIAKKFKVSIVNFKSYRSDFNSQVFEITINTFKNNYFFDSYGVGDEKSKDRFLKSFEEFINHATLNNI